MDPKQANLLGWMVAAIVLFVFLMPEFPFQIPGQSRILEFSSFILVHGIIHIAVIVFIFIVVTLIGIVAAMTIIDAIPFPFMLLLVITIVMTQRWRTRSASPQNSQARPTTGMLPSRVAQFSAQDLQQITHGFSEVLGSNGIVVYKGEFRDGVPVAVKVLKDDMSGGGEKQFIEEVDILIRTHHINLVRLYGFCFEPNMTALIYECMDKGSLNSFLFGDQEEPLAWYELHKIAVGIAKGIAYLHEECEQRIIHCELKPENVLLDANLNAKVADFGLAKLCNPENTRTTMSDSRGTYGYTAPELGESNQATHKCDVYSFGMLLFEIVRRRRNSDFDITRGVYMWFPIWAYNMSNEGKLIEMLSYVGIPEEDREEASRMVKVALWCVQSAPEARPMMSLVVKMLEGDVGIDVPPIPFYGQL